MSKKSAKKVVPTQAAALSNSNAKPAASSKNAKTAKLKKPAKRVVTSISFLGTVGTPSWTKTENPASSGEYDVHINSITLTPGAGESAVLANEQEPTATPIRKSAGGITLNFGTPIHLVSTGGNTFTGETDGHETFLPTHLLIKVRWVSTEHAVEKT